MVIIIPGRAYSPDPDAFSRLFLRTMPRPSTQVFALLLPVAGLAGLFTLLQTADRNPAGNPRPALTSPAEVASRAEAASRAEVASSALATPPPQPPIARPSVSQNNEARQQRARRRDFFPDAAAETEDKTAAAQNAHLRASENTNSTTTFEAQQLEEFVNKTRPLTKHFLSWADDYAGAENKSDRQALLVEGLYRANLRREVMNELMRRAPEEAIKRSLPLHVYHALPREIQARVETPFSALVTILPAESAVEESPENPIRRFRIQFPGEKSPLECIAFGRRSKMHPKEICAVQGIRLQDLAVLREDVIQLLQTRAIPPTREIFPLANPDPTRCFATGQPLRERITVGLAGGRLVYFRDERVLLEFNRKIGALDALPDPQLSSRSLFLPGAIPSAESGFDFAFARQTPPAAAAP